MEKETSSLLTIGGKAFENSNLTYSLEDSLLIPSSVISIGGGCFSYNDNMVGVAYRGTNQDILNNTSNWYNSSTTTLNPVIE